MLLVLDWFFGSKKSERNPIFLKNRISDKIARVTIYNNVSFSISYINHLLINYLILIK